VVDALVRFVAPSTPSAHWTCMVTPKLAASTLIDEYVSQTQASANDQKQRTGSQLNNLPFLL